jgi:hypothetical protein
VSWDNLYVKGELGLTVVLNVWFVNICMGKGELGLTVVLNV